MLFSFSLLGLQISDKPVYLDVTDFGAIANDSNDDSSAFQTALDKLNHNGVLFIPQGEYQICKTLYLRGKNNVEIVGMENNKLKKCNSFDGEYLLNITYTKNLTIRNIYFEGIHNGDKKPIWGEQGVYLGSTKGTVVTQNQFFHFGDAALRITTASDDFSTKLGSHSISVNNNKFEKCAQVTTTQAKTNSEMAGTNNILIENNQFISCKLKLSARAETRGATIKDNIFSNINGTASEISYYSDVIYINNYFSNINGFSINIYPNSRTTKKIQWGNISIINNVFKSNQQGIRLQSFSEHDKRNKPIKNIRIEKNKFSDIYFGDDIEKKYRTIIRTNTRDNQASFEDIRVVENQYQLTPLSDFLSIDNESKKVSIKDNEISKD
ncbi:right-handed parallel beta-helix repeat-containing protein [Vibrio cholerae]